ncbi:hypothetical protein TNCV_3703431 [Trichonephila clavipes]|nr:hypothetical protein TNCV_3703431 [Trichonephila clavipes]
MTLSYNSVGLMVHGALFLPNQQAPEIAIQCESGLVCEEYRSSLLSGPGNVFSCPKERDTSPVDGSGRHTHN